ncbi:MAG TPA: DNA methyltransferase [Verrucomicrobiae bacterium]
MTWAELKRKWSRYAGKESAAYQEHFNDLCHLLGHPTPAEADPTGSEAFCFQKRVVKDAELFLLNDDGSPVGDSDDPERGFADVWKKGCFGWEYKGKKKNLDEAYRQLLRYREALLNPPLLIVCDFERYIIRTNFNGTVQETHEFTNDQIDRPENIRLLRAAFTDPDFLKPQRTTAQVTEQLAATIAKVAKSLQRREAVELADAKSRAELSFAQRKNLRIARFLNRIVFCFFAEDTGLLPKHLFTDILKTGLGDLHHLAETLEHLFQVMAKGGHFGKDKIRHFNGHLFEDSTVFELTEDELRQLADAGEADWQFIQPGIMGTLFERALDFEEGGKLRAQLGAHYTSEADIKTLVEPVLMAPLRRQWAALKAELAAAYVKGRGTPAQRDKLAAFQKQLANTTILDPACGSGNFLYVSLQMLLDLEKEAITYATQLGFNLAPLIGVHQLCAIEINPYAFELAQVSVQIGYLQWRRDNGFDNNRSPVLQNLDGFQNEDALLVPHFHSKAKSLKEAQAGEHQGDNALKFYTEREWPKADVIVGNPPFLGGSKLWEELGRHYQQELWRVYEGRVPGFADLCCYWFEKARQQIERGSCRRAGLLATQGIRGGVNREVLKRIKETGDIFFAESDRPWILAGAAVNVSMIGFDDGTATELVLNSARVSEINANLTSHLDITEAKMLTANLNICFIGSKKAGEFEVPDEIAREWLDLPNPHGRPNSDVLRLWVNGDALIKARRSWWIVDAGASLPLDVMSRYVKPFEWVVEKVKPERDKNNEPRTRDNFWIHKRPGPDMRHAVSNLWRCLAVVRHAKHLIFSWLNPSVLPDDGIYVFATDRDSFLGVMQSSIHRIWALRQGTQLEDRPRYTPTTCFETFPFPFRDDLKLPPDKFAPPPAHPSHPDLTPEKAYADAAHFYSAKEDATAYRVPSTPEGHREAIAAAAKELNELRERWLNPPEWTQTGILEFPGSLSGPWERYLDPKTVDPETGVGTVRYPRLEPRDADCAGKLKKRTLTNLYNERPAWLDLAHKKLDAAVAAAYGWPSDLSDDQILERLLKLNLDRAAAEKSEPTPRASQRAKDESDLL